MRTLIGHKSILTYFEKIIAAGKLHHAYALVGPEHVGKTTLAKHIIATILKTPIEKIDIHPDFLHVKRVDEDGNLKKDITIEHMESVTSKVMMTPFASPYNIILIEDAHKMNSYAANALLKTLEEPATPTIFFLLTESTDLLLPTICSRLHPLQVSRVPIDTLRSDLQQELGDNPDFEEMLYLSSGLPGFITKWQEDKESFEEYKSEIQRFFSLFHKPLFEKMALVESLFADKKAHIEGRKELESILHIWERSLQIAIERKDHMVRSLSFPQLSSSIVVPIYDTIKEAIFGLNQNVHPKLLVENILLQIP